MAWSQRVLQLLHRMNSFHAQGSIKCLCKPFYVGGQRVGSVPPGVLPHLGRYPGVFLVDEGLSRVELSSGLGGYSERSEALDVVLREWKEEKLFDCLEGWRDEKYEVMGRSCDPPLMNMERAATSLFGVKRYGVHLNGFVRRSDGQMSMWIGRRALSKPTYPGMLDNMAAGGLAAGLGIKEALVKECAEEACVPERLAARAQPAGTVSYCYEDGTGIFAECQFVYDLEVPTDFTPTVGDGEVQEFYLWPLQQVRDAIVDSDFKPNCALVVLDFMIRHGFIQPDTERYYHQFVEGLHTTL
uniref:Nudix hydrolase 20, chloroplastic-like protein n=1 Tax=Callorhinchus milii TaxID=7868 RepID=V9L4U2_CALMI